MDIRRMAQECRAAAMHLAAVDSEVKDAALDRIAEAIDAGRSEIIRANDTDLKRGEAGGLAQPLLKRLKFDNKKIDEAILGIRSLIDLPDPVGKTLEARELDKGLELYKVSCPIGVIGVIFESRPDALVQISSLCLKSGNGVLLKGGSEALETNRVLARIIAEAGSNIKAGAPELRQQANKGKGVQEHRPETGEGKGVQEHRPETGEGKGAQEHRPETGEGIPDGWLQLLETRSDVNEMLKMDEYIDLIIPRGSNEFVKYIMENSSIPVLGHAEGICHCYIDKYADIEKAVRIAVDSKTQYVAVCNAAETLLVHRDIAAEVLPLIKKEFDAKGVTVYACDGSRAIMGGEAATEESWGTEYLDYKMSVRIVGDIDEAIDHINKYGSGHTDVIVTEHKENASRFLTGVDSADVFLNCSTRFADGFRFGLGAEVGISTNKIHARGPVGMEGLLIYKYKLIGNGQIVEDYASGGRKFTHRKIEKNCEY